MAGKGDMIQTKKMTSIVRKLHWNFMRKQIGTFLKMDILFMFLLFFGWILNQEITCLGKISFFYDRGIEREGHWKEWVYYVQKDTGEFLLRLRLYNGLRVIGGIIICLLILQMLSITFSYHKEEKKIRHILNPINELALKADALNRMSFSEDKYQIIEEAISHIQPEEEKQLSFGDEDLAGIEVAMNNLLIRMQDVYRQQARFVNDASHELRTPIAVIEGYVNMLARWGVEDEKVLTESITALQRESGHMKHLVEQLLFLARGDSGKTQLEFVHTSLKDCMQEIYEESLLIDEEHVYRYKVPIEDIVVLADTMMLKQAVRILVDNAAKYTKFQDEIILSVGRTENGDSYLQVQDTGIGMEEADISHMFERFYRSDDARKYKGTGLGLSIAKWIVDKHQGYFEILSRTNLGTRIRIILPKGRMC